MTQFLRKTLTAAAIAAVLAVGGPALAQDKPAAAPAAGAAASKPPVDTKAIDA